MDSEFKIIENKILSRSLTLLPKIDIKELASFEDEFHLELPKDYKWFLSEVGSGFENTLRFLSPKDWRETFWTKPSTINPFNYSCEIAFDHEFKSNWLEFIKNPIKEEDWREGKWDPMFGTIAIGEIGCGLYYRMILNGDLKNNIFVWGDHAFNPPKFLEKAGYLNWVDFQIEAFSK